MARKKSSSTRKPKEADPPKSDVPTGIKECELCGSPANSFHHPDCIAVIPKFLRRTGPKLTPEQIKRMLGTEREWIMPDKRKYEKEFYMPIDKITPTDPLKPVQVNLVTEAGRQARFFDNLEKFEEWYNPELYVLSGQITDASLTIVTAETHEARKAAPESAEVRRRAAQVMKERAAQEKRERKEKRKAERAERSGGKEGRPKKEGGGMTGSIAVTVAGKSYGTIKTALKALGIPDSERKALRAALISSGTATLKGHVFALRDGAAKDAAPKAAAPADKKEESKKAESKKAESKKAESKKAESKKAESKKAESKKAESKKAESKKDNGLQSMVKKAFSNVKTSSKKPEPKKVVAKKTAAKTKKKGGKK